MEIRKIQMEDANNYLDMLLNLDNETKFMMFEPGERPTDINIIKNIIEKSINGDNLILVAKDEENIVGFLSAQKGEYKRIKHTGYIVVGIREKYRGKGIGSKLFKFMENELKEEIEYVLLSTATKNYKAILHFYIDELEMHFWNARLFKKIK